MTGRNARAASGELIPFAHPADKAGSHPFERSDALQAGIDGFALLYLAFFVCVCATALGVVAWVFLTVFGAFDLRA